MVHCYNDRQDLLAIHAPKPIAFKHSNMIMLSQAGHIPAQKTKKQARSLAGSAALPLFEGDWTRRMEKIDQA
jgi:hypothetical protein